jgi:hypothetical protein
MVAQGDILQFIDVQKMVGYTNEILNVYNFEVVSITAETPLQVYGEDLQQAFNANIIGVVKTIQSSALTHVRLEIKNLTFQQEEYVHEWSTAIPGSRPGDYVPSNLTYSFRLQRYSKLLRNGRKSISGVPDDAIETGRVLSAAYTSTVSTVAAAIGSFWPVEGSVTDATLNPLIVRIPANPGVAPTVYTPVTQAAFIGFGTMNTRKQL